MIHEKHKITINEHSAELVTYVIDNSEEMDMQRTRPAILICPGGGYAMTSDREAEPIALKFMSYGFHVFVLRYSVAPARYPIALCQLATAMKWIRQRSEEWHINQDKIVVAGFSAGGHLAGNLGVAWKNEIIQHYVDGQPDDWKPNGLMLAYPVLTSGEYGHQDSFKNLLGEQYDLKEEHSLETLVSKDTPPVFLWHTGEDGLVPAENSLLFALALRKHHVPFELHHFPKGGHGLSLGTEETKVHGEYGDEESVVIWPELFKDWIKYNI